MKIKIILLTLIVAASTAVGAPSPTAEENSNRLLESIETGDFELFTQNSEPAFKKIEEKAFAAVVKQMRPRMEKGYQVTFLGTLKQKGYSVTLWKIEFSKGDDALATLSIRGDKVGGYFIH
jgi:hypothetical protein